MKTLMLLLLPAVAGASCLTDAMDLWESWNGKPPDAAVIQKFKDYGCTAKIESEQFHNDGLDTGKDPDYETQRQLRQVNDNIRELNHQLRELEYQAQMDRIRRQ